MAASTFEGRVVVPRFRSARRSWWWLARVAATAAVAGLVVVAWPHRDAGPAGSIERVDPSTYFGSFVEFAVLDAGLWAWDFDGHIGRYADGDWYRYAALPAAVGPQDIAIRADGTVIVGTSTGLFQLQDDVWQRAPESPSEVVAVEVDPVTGDEWWSTERGLYRWDGSEAVPLPEPPIPAARMADEMVAGGDGSLWVGTNNTRSYSPELGGLAHYRHDDASWEAVRPLGGIDDIPARVGRTADGGLWAMLADWAPDWERARDAGETYATWWPARLDADSQTWTVHDGLPDVYPFAMAVGADAVWFAQGPSNPKGFDELAGVLRFDGETWTRYLDVEVFSAVGVAGDGTVWVSTLGRAGITQLDTSLGRGRT